MTDLYLITATKFVDSNYINRKYTMQTIPESKSILYFISDKSPVGLLPQFKSNYNDNFGRFTDW